MKRTVTVQVGVPEGFPQAPITKMPHGAECYSIDFSELEVIDGEMRPVRGFTVQCLCLCTLIRASGAWLMGEPLHAIERIMARHTHRK